MVAGGGRGVGAEGVGMGHQAESRGMTVLIKDLFG